MSACSVVSGTLMWAGGRPPEPPPPHCEARSPPPGAPPQVTQCPRPHPGLPPPPCTLSLCVWATYPSAGQPGLRGPQQGRSAGRCPSLLRPVRPALRPVFPRPVGGWQPLGAPRTELCCPCCSVAPPCLPAGGLWGHSGAEGSCGDLLLLGWLVSAMTCGSAACPVPSRCPTPTQ